MVKPVRQKYLICTLILALFTMGISPACHFVSGNNNIIEICTAFGVERIALPNESFPHSDSHSDIEAPCVFCFAAADGKVLSSSFDYAEQYEAFRAVCMARVYQIRRHDAGGPIQTRAPPVRTA